MSGFDPADGWSSWPAPAKLNLFLRITGRRADGYHLLQTVVRLLEWGDTVHLRPRADGAIGRIGPAAEGVAEADDLMVRAAKLLQSEANCSQGVDIGVEKRTPMGGGFGGGSSDAATVLVVLDRLWGLGLGEDRLAERRRRRAGRVATAPLWRRRSPTPASSPTSRTPRATSRSTRPSPTSSSARAAA